MHCHAIHWHACHPRDDDNGKTKAMARAKAKAMGMTSFFLCGVGHGSGMSNGKGCSFICSVHNGKDIDKQYCCINACIHDQRFYEQLLAAEDKLKHRAAVAYSLQQHVALTMVKRKAMAKAKAKAMGMTSFIPLWCWPWFRHEKWQRMWFHL